MKKVKKILLIVLLNFIICLCISCSLPMTNSNNKTESLHIKNIVLKLKEKNEFEDREILNINKLVLAEWHQAGSSISIIPLDNKGDLVIDECISLSFDGPPNYDFYGKDGYKADFVEKFMEQINEKRLNGISLNNFIRKDLIVSLEFSDDTKIIFDRYYKEIEENIDEYRDFLQNN